MLRQNTNSFNHHLLFLFLPHPPYLSLPLHFSPYRSLVSHILSPLSPSQYNSMPTSLFPTHLTQINLMQTYSPFPSQKQINNEHTDVQGFSLRILNLGGRGEEEGNHRLILFTHVGGEAQIRFLIFFSTPASEQIELTSSCLDWINIENWSISILQLYRK